MHKESKHRKYYLFLIRLFKSLKLDETKLSLSIFICEYAAWNYIGKLREPILENFFNYYNLKYIEKTKPKFTLVNGKESIIHIFTTIYETGGHSRLAENIIMLDEKRIHHIIVTNQGNITPRHSLLEKVKENGGSTLFLNDSDIINKCNSLLEFVCTHANKVILHINANDPLPSMALNSVKNSIEIIFVNHADSAFTFGLDIASKVINIREEAHRMTAHLRNFTNSFVLPLPIIKQQFTEQEIDQIKQKYNVQNDEVIALTIGSAYKFNPNSSYDFFDTWSKALERNSKLHLWVVGMLEKDCFSIKEIQHHDRIRFFGVVNDPAELQAVADIIVDPMPFGSYTSLLESSFYGAYPLVCYNAIPLFDLTQDPSFKDEIYLDPNENSYLNHIFNFCDGKVDLNRQQIRENIKHHHSGEAWIKKLDQILSDKTNSIAEKPTEPNRLDEFNQSVGYIKNRYLVYFYANINSFGFREQIKIITFLTFNNFKNREILGIIKKIFVK